VLGLIHVYKNVYADLCWLPLICTTACEDFLKQLIEVGNMDKVMWGCDTWTSIESYGAVLAIRKVLSKVFSSYVDEGYLSLDLAKEHITHILSQNARKLFCL
jgi:predicted TIM-barrel fold metal-dependent hydrolase